MANDYEPRICRILGVKVDQRFKIDDYSSEFYIDSCGDLRADGILMGGACSALTEAINFPELIELRPRWTEQDIEDAKAVKRLWPNATHVKVDGLKEKQVCTYAGDVGCIHARISDESFPSLGVYESVALNDILKGGAENGD